jgi:hypothetical protein
MAWRLRTETNQAQPWGKPQAPTSPRAWATPYGKKKKKKKKKIIINIHKKNILLVYIKKKKK